MPPVIRIRDLGKRYRLGEQTTLHGGLGRWVRRRFRPAPPGGPDAGGDTEFWALRNVSLDVERGQVLGIIGRNGAGKSTLLKIISRIISPTTGEVRLHGRLASLLEVGTGFHPDLTGRENIFLNGSILGMTRREIRGKLDAIVEFAGIPGFIDTPVKRYSSGMYTRLAFSVAAHLDPDILVVDEVLSVGDAEFQQRCIGKMQDVTGAGRTVLFVSHNMSAVQRLCSRVVVMEGGQAVFDGDPATAVERYLASMGRRKASADGQAHDLTSWERELPFLGHRARITSCCILDSQGQASGQVRFGEPFTVRATVRIVEDEPRVSVLVGINAADDARISTDVSEDQEQFFDVAAGELLTVEAMFDDLLLMPGTYRIAIGVRSGDQGLDKLEGCAAVEVIAAAHDRVRPPVTRVGYVQARPRWRRVEPAATAR